MVNILSRLKGHESSSCLALRSQSLFQRILQSLKSYYLCFQQLSYPQCLSKQVILGLCLFVVYLAKTIAQLMDFQLTSRKPVRYNSQNLLYPSSIVKYNFQKLFFSNEIKPINYIHLYILKIKTFTMQNQPLALIQKKNISSEDIKEIVLYLNEPPFQAKISLVDLDQYNTFELGDLVFKIFKFLDNQININAKQTPPADIIFHVTQFLRVLSYESDFSQDWQNGLLNGDKKVIYPIYYFLLKNLHSLKKRAYLAKFLVSIQVPQQFSGDPQIKSLNQKTKELQVQFQITHEQYQAIQSSSLNPAQLKKQINRYEQQKEQLSTRINSMKTKHGSKPQMTAMLVATNLLRRQQEEGANIMDKIQSYREQLQNAQAKLMSFQQSLADARKSTSPNNSPQQMLYAIRNEVKKNRQVVNQRMTVQYNQRLKKLQQTQKLLSQPPITQNQLMMLENSMTGLRRTVNQMQQKLSKQSGKDDKLAIYKGQAALVTKKKQQTQQQLKRQQQDMSRLQSEIRKKQQQINKIKGVGFKKNKLQDYLSQLKEKKAKYAKCKQQIQQIKWQASNLQRSQQLLKDQKARFQKAFGLVEGERLIADKAIDNASVQEINRQIQKLLEQIRKKKNALAPKLQQRKQTLQQFQTIENQYKTKKQSFLGITTKIEDDIKEIQTVVNKVRNQVYTMDTKIKINQLKNELIELKMQRLNEENNNIKGSGKGFSESRSYQEYIKTKVQKDAKERDQLALQRQRIAEKHAPSMEQKRMFNDLKKIMMCKMQTGRESQNMNKGQKFGNNVNVLQL